MQKRKKGDWRETDADVEEGGPIIRSRIHEQLSTRDELRRKTYFMNIARERERDRSIKKLLSLPASTKPSL